MNARWLLPLFAQDTNAASRLSDARKLARVHTSRASVLGENFAHQRRETPSRSGLTFVVFCLRHQKLSASIKATNKFRYAERKVI